MYQYCYGPSAWESLPISAAGAWSVRIGSGGYLWTKRRRNSRLRRKRRPRRNANGMLIDAFRKTVDRSPRTLAVSDSVSSLTYGRLARLASVLRDVIARETSCQRVGIMLPASSVFPAVLFGTLWSSKVAVPLNFLLHVDELKPIVEDAELDLIVTVRHFADLAARLPARTLFLEALPLKRRVLFSALRRLPPTPQVDPNDTAVILYTSGTTGSPKGVELSHHNLHSNCVDTIELLQIKPNNRFLNLLPPFHVFGLTANVLVPAVLGASVYAIPRFSPVATIKTVREKQITIVLAIPSMYAAILKSKSATRDTFASVYLAVSGGEPLPHSVRQRFQDRFGVAIREGYGLTETSPVIAAGSPDRYKVGTVGMPVPNTEIRIVSEDGTVLPATQDGEILVRGPGVMKGYYRRPEETRRVIDADGWFSTGDIGNIDEEGYLSITGRAKEMLIIGGENVFPREIEAALESHKDVLQAAVIGVPDELRGEAPVAFVIPRPGADIAEQSLRNHVKKLLAGYKTPKSIEICTELPTGPTGKILKRVLRERL